MKAKKRRVVPAAQGCGSTIILFDMLLDEKSNRELAFNPKLLDKRLGYMISQSGMNRRTGILDAFETVHRGPSTSFHSIGESHKRVSVGNFKRAETWPKELHVNGETQLCNYSRDNSKTALHLAKGIIVTLNPLTWEILIVTRGPGHPLRPRESQMGKRGLSAILSMRWPKLNW